MSKNRRNKIEVSKAIGLDKSAINKISKSTFFTYLKANWLMVLLIAFLSFGALGASLKYLEDSAKRQMAQGKNPRVSKGETEESLLNSINPFLPVALPTPTPQLSKELIYSGQKLVAVEDSNATVAPPADIAVWRPSSGVWWVMGQTGSQQTSQGWGNSTDIPVQGDYDGDGKTDFSIFRPSTNTWWVFKSSDSNYYSVTFGTSGDKVAPADYDGDGKTDLGIFRPSNSTWYIFQSSNSQSIQYQFGLSTDLPAPKDYDGDGRADIAVWRNSNKTFYSLNTSNNQIPTATFTDSSTIPVSADYDGDGRADYAIRNGANWLIKYSSNGQTETIPCQQSTDTEVQNDYDGDGKVDIAVWRNSNGNWYIRKSSTNTLRQEAWGTSGDIPVPAFYRR